MLPTIAALMALSMTPQIESSFRSGVYLSIFSDGWRKSYVEGLFRLLYLASAVSLEGTGELQESDTTLIVHLTISNLTFRKHTNLWEDIQFSFKVANHAMPNSESIHARNGETRSFSSSFSRCVAISSSVSRRPKTFGPGRVKRRNKYINYSSPGCWQCTDIAGLKQRRSPSAM
jgi:hypothetical protein